MERKIKQFVILISFLMLGNFFLIAYDYDDFFINFFNTYRKNAKLSPVKLNQNLSRGCIFHAKYLVINGTSAKNFNSHEEDKTLIGYSDQGKVSGKNSIIIGKIEPDIALQYFMSTVQYRIPILNPGLKNIGFGYYKGGNWEIVTVVDVLSDVGDATTDIVLYPSEDQEEVPVAFGLQDKQIKVNDLLDPLPEDKDKLAGFPITITFIKKQIIRNVKANFYTRDNIELPVWVYWPEKPAIDIEKQQNSIAIIPGDFLKNNTYYRVVVNALVNNIPWKKEWKFKTVKE